MHALNPDLTHASLQRLFCSTGSWPTDLWPPVCPLPIVSMFPKQLPQKGDGGFCVDLSEWVHSSDSDIVVLCVGPILSPLGTSFQIKSVAWISPRCLDPDVTPRRKKNNNNPWRRISNPYILLVYSHTVTAAYKNHLKHLAEITECIWPNTQ